MIASLLLVFLVLSQDVDQQARSSAEQALREVGALRQVVQSELRPGCSASVRWQAGSSLRAQDPQTPIAVGLVSMVSAPRDACLNAELRITANYYEGSGAFICSGTVSLPQVDLVQNTLFEFRPYLSDYFAKWKDAPTWEQSTFHRLVCNDYDGIESRDPSSRAALLKLFITVLPKRGGLATDELNISIARQTSR